MNLGLSRKLAFSYEDALARLPEALKAEGFGVLTEIDIKETLQKKLGVSFRKYRIVGACNPSLAYEALQKNLSLGVLLPCNVVIYEDDDGRALVTVVDPLQTTAALGDGELAIFAETVRERLVRILRSL